MSGKSGVDRLVEVLESLSDEDVEKMANLIGQLIENLDALTQTLNLLKQLKESGILEAATKLLEGVDELFNAMARHEVMKPVANVMMLVYMLSNLNYETLFQLAETMPKCMDKAMDEVKRTEKGMGLLELMRLMRSPEMAALLKAMIAMSSCMRGE